MVKTEGETIIVFNHHGIGDFINAINVHQCLRIKYPQGRIVAFVRNPQNLELLEDGLVDKYLVWSANWFRIIRLIFQIAFLKPTIFVCTTETAHSSFIGLLSIICRPNLIFSEDNLPWFTLGVHRCVKFNYQENKVISNQRLCDVIGINNVKATLAIAKELSNRALSKAIIPLFRPEKCPNLIIGVAPGCHPFLQKRWPPNNFKGLIRRIISETDCIVIILGGLTEAAIAKDITIEFNNNLRVINAVGKTTLSETALLISRMDLLCCNDTGLGHMAAALDIKTVCLMGPTSIKRCAPYRKSRVITMQKECSPCYPRLKFGCGDPVCMKTISVDHVYDNCIHTLGSL